MISYDFKEGQLVRLFHGVPDQAWDIYKLPTKELRACLRWNDKDGDFDHLKRATLLEIFLFDFIVNKGQR